MFTFPKIYATLQYYLALYQVIVATRLMDFYRSLLMFHSCWLLIIAHQLFHLVSFLPMDLFYILYQEDLKAICLYIFCFSYLQYLLFDLA